MAQCVKCKQSKCGCEIVNGVCANCRAQEAERKLQEKATREQIVATIEKEKGQ